MNRRVWPPRFLCLLLVLGGLALVGFQSSVWASEPKESFLSKEAPFDAFSVEIPMRDGKHLAGDVYIPKKHGKYPVILIQTSYNKKNIRVWFTGEMRHRRGPLFTNTHYAFVVTDWRGRFASKDALTPTTRGGSGQDGYDTFQWIIQQDWCNGKIGTWGGSALAGVQFRTAKENPPNLVCMAPSIMPLNLGYDIYFPGGVLWAEFSKFLGRLGWNVYDMLAQRPVKNAAWKAIEAATFVKGEEIRVPTLLVSGWYDLYTDGVLAALETIRTQGGEKARTNTKLIMGPWLHSYVDLERQGELSYPGAVMFSAGKTVAFFDHWLRDVDTGFEKEPTITYYQMGAEEWRSSEVWPPKTASDRSYYLYPGGELSTSKPAGGGEPSSYKFDPSNPMLTVGGANLDRSLLRGPCDQRQAASLREDTLVFNTPVLSEDLAIAGMVRANLYVSSDRPDTDFTAILIDMYPDGRWMLVCEGILRMRFRNTTEKEELMTPGTTYEITIDLENTALTFLKGHRVGVIISSSSYPRYDVNLNDGGPLYQGGKGVVATNSIYHDAARPSALILPVDTR